MMDRKRKVKSKSFSKNSDKTLIQQTDNAKCKRAMVSVIIPTFNRAKSIGRTIDSVLAQTEKNYEVVVVDDGSTDDTRQVLEPYMERIQYIYQDNSGCAAARNTGIQASHGEWLAFLDSDDRWHPEYLKRQMSCIEHLPVNVCFTNTDFDYDGKKEFLNINADFSVTHDAQLIEEPLEFIMTNNETYTVLQGMLIKRKLLRRVGGFDERFYWGTDMRFMLQLATEEPIAYINQKLVIVDRTRDKERLTEDRDMNTEAGKGLRNMRVLTYAEMYFRCCNKNKKVVKKIRRILGAYISSFAISCCMERRSYDARRFALDGIYFGRDLRTYAKCAAVLICPWLVRRFHPH